MVCFDQRGYLREVMLFASVALLKHLTICS